MTKSLSLVFAILSFSLTGCGDPDLHWKDGNYRVYSRASSREIILGYHMGDGGVLGLSEANVTAAGANETHVVYQLNSSKYYYLVRLAEGEATPIGPFSKSEYARLVEELSLPPFQWHLDR